MGAKLTFDILRDIKTHHSILPSFVATIVTISFLYVLGFFETKVAMEIDIHFVYGNEIEHLLDKCQLKT